jgi:hypothetical protein
MALLIADIKNVVSLRKGRVTTLGSKRQEISSMLCL